MNIKKIKLIGAHVLVFSVLMLPLVVTAALPGQPPTPTQTTVSGTIPNPFKGGSSLMGLLATIMSDIVMPIAAIGVVMWVIWAGFQFVLAQGNSSALEKAKLNLLYSLVGAGILLGAVGIAEVLKTTVNALIAP